MKQLQPKAILTGLVVALGGQLLFGYLLLFVCLNSVLIPRSVAAGEHLRLSNAEMKQVVFDITATPAYMIATILLKVIFTLAGAFLTAHYAREKPMPNVLVMGVICLVYSIWRARLLLTLTPSLWPLWFTLLLVISNLFLIPLGACWRIKTRKNTHPSTAISASDIIPPIPDVPPIAKPPLDI